MNQVAIGRYIAQKRRSKNLTQEQLAQALGVSNKTISKWENGRCLPDYGIVQPLCEALGVTLAELMDGEDAAEDSMRAYDDEHILELLRRVQELERGKQCMSGVLLIAMGIAGCALASSIGGSDFKDFASGLLMGLSIVEMTAGLIGTVKYLPEK